MGVLALTLTPLVQCPEAEAKRLPARNGPQKGGDIQQAWAPSPTHGFFSDTLLVGHVSIHHGSVKTTEDKVNLETLACWVW